MYRQFHEITYTVYLSVNITLTDQKAKAKEKFHVITYNTHGSESRCIKRQIHEIFWASLREKYLWKLSVIGT
jgi:hypothetical protein